MSGATDVVLFRHGIAEDATQRGISDADRQLTSKGQQRTAQAAEGLARWLSEPIQVIHSPLARARETAVLVAEACSGDAYQLDTLAPGSTPDAVWRDLLAREATALPIVVGHEPDLSLFIAAAVGAERGGGFRMKKAAACRLRLSQGVLGSASLQWLLPPRALRTMAAA